VDGKEYYFSLLPGIRRVEGGGGGKEGGRLTNMVEGLVV
jgi:hypothetical protein